MPTLYLIRHGQASFGADDYDQLSPMGQQQSLRLGQWFRAKGIAFDAALTGTLTRQIQTFAGISEGLGLGIPVTRHAALNEYDSHAVIATVHAQPLEKPSTPELYRHHFRLLKSGLALWMAGTAQPAGMPSYREFADGIAQVLESIRQGHSGNVLLVSSGGPIATAVGQVLGTSPETTIELNLRIRNASITEFAFTPKRHMLVSYNALPHLDAPEHASWVTYA